MDSSTRKQAMADIIEHYWKCSDTLFDKLTCPSRMPTTDEILDAIRDGRVRLRDKEALAAVRPFYRKTLSGAFDIDPLIVPEYQSPLFEGAMGAVSAEVDRVWRGIVGIVEPEHVRSEVRQCKETLDKIVTETLEKERQA